MQPAETDAHPRQETDESFATSLGPRSPSYRKSLPMLFIAQLGRDLPGPMSGFAPLHKKSVEEGALSDRVKELMALAVSIAVRCEGCLSYHVHDAVAAGATRQELLETIGVAVIMGGCPAPMYAAHAQDAIEQFLPQPASGE